MRLQSVYAIMIRDLRMFLRDKATLFWVIAWPLIWVFMVAYVFIPVGAGEPVTLTLGVVVEDNTTGPFTAEDLLEVLGNASYEGKKLFNVRIYENTTALLEALRRGELDAGIVVPLGFSVNLTWGQAELVVFVDGASPYETSVARVVLDAFLREFSKKTAEAKINATLSFLERVVGENPEWWKRVAGPWAGNRSFLEALRVFYRGLVEPVKPVYETVRPEAVEDRPRLIGWYTIGAVGMMMLYTGFSLGAGLVVQEREGGRLRRMLATPLTEAELLAGRILGGLALLALSTAVAMVAGVYGAGAEIAWSPLEPSHWAGALMLLVGALLSIGLGVPLGLLAKTPSGASSLGTALGLLLAFTAGIWFPREWMPGPAQLLAKVFPVTWSLDTARDLLVYGKPLQEAMPAITACLAALAAIYILDIQIYKMLLRRYLEA